MFSKIFKEYCTYGILSGHDSSQFTDFVAAIKLELGIAQKA
jgi:hypothetical protein